MFDFYYQSIDFANSSQKLVVDKALKCSKLTSQCLANFIFQHNVFFKTFKKDKACKFPIKFCLRIVAKTFIHWMFRCVYRINRFHLPERTKLIKSWVEINVTEWEQNIDLQTSTVLVLPFSIDFFRQWNYIQFLRNEKVSHTLYGYNYSFYKLLVFCIKRDMNSLLDLEIHAQKHYVRDIINSNCKELYVMDDVEFYSHYSNSLLKRLGVNVYFTAHGIGCYSPYYSCTHYKLFNDSQVSFFRQFNFLVSYDVKYQPSGKFKVSDIENFHAVCFISQLSKTQSSEYSLIEDRLLSSIKCSSHTNLDLLFKKHPNSQSIDCPSGYREIDKLETYKGKILFLTLYSTAYYTFQKYGQTVLIETTDLNPSNIFGSNERVILENELDKLLSRN